MTKSKLESLYLETEHGTFTPIYTYENYTPIEEEKSYTETIVIGVDEETGEEIIDEVTHTYKEIVDYMYEGFVLIKTSKEVYDEWLYDKQHPPIILPDENKTRFEQIEEAIGMLATQVAKNTLLQSQGGI